MIVLILYTSIRPRTVTNTIHNPSLTKTAELQREYFGTVECPCTRAYIPYEELVTINVQFHQVRHRYIVIVSRMNEHFRSVRVFLFPKNGMKH